MSSVSRMKLPIYLDYQATTPVDKSVLDTMLPYFSEHFGNASSRSHEYGWRTEEAVEVARGQIAALLGASPGASFAVKVMLDVLETSFAREVKSEKWQAKLREMIPSYGRVLSGNPDLILELRARSKRVLDL